MTLHRPGGKSVSSARAGRRLVRSSGARLRRTVSSTFVALAAIGGAFATDGGAGHAADGAVESIEVDGAVSTVRTIRVTEGPGPSALIVGLHGYGMDERQMRTLVDVAPVRAHRYVAVRGFEPLDDGGHAWFPVALVEGRPVWSTGDVRGAVTRLSRLVSRLAERHDIDDEDVFVVGYSQGATMALATALLAPGSAAGFVGFAGSVPPDLAPFAARDAASRPVLIGHGTRDGLISRGDVARSVEVLQALGHDVEVASFAVPHVVSAAGRTRIVDWLDEQLAGPP